MTVKHLPIIWRSPVGAAIAIKVLNKGTDLGSFDPQTGTFSFLFNPRTQQWTEHFMMEEHQILGLTIEGRTTVKLLKFNSDERLAERQRLRDRF